MSKPNEGTQASFESHQMAEQGSAVQNLRLTLRQPSCCCTATLTCIFHTFQTLAAVSGLLLGWSDHTLVSLAFQTHGSKGFFKVENDVLVGCRAVSCVYFTFLHPVTQQDACVGGHLLDTLSLLAWTKAAPQTQT